MLKYRVEWRRNCQLLIEFDDFLTRKDQEIAELRDWLQRLTAECGGGKGRRWGDLQRGDCTHDSSYTATCNDWRELSHLTMRACLRGMEIARSWTRAASRASHRRH